MESAEEEPLLLPDEATAASQGKWTQWTVRRQAIASHLTEWNTVYLIGLFIFIDDLGGQIRIAPEVQMLEALVCRDYLQRHDSLAIGPDGGVLWHDCKIDAVQIQLSNLRQGLSFVRGITQLIVVLPFGFLADSIGRRVVIALSLLSLILADGWMVLVCYFHDIFSIHMIWLSAAFLILGGGPPVMNTVVYALITDATGPEKRINAFFYISTVNLIVELCGPVLGAFLMVKTTIYFTFMVEISLEISALFVISSVPKSLLSDPSTSTSDPVVEVTPGTDPRSEVIRKSSRLNLQQGMAFLRKLRVLVSTRPSVFFAISAYLTNRFGRQLMSWMLQYVSKRMDWSFADTSIFFSIRPVVNILLFAVVIPWLSHLLMTRLHFSPPQATLLLAKGSLYLLIVGCLIMGFLPHLISLVMGLIIFACGWGFSNLVQLFASTATESDQMVTLYAAFSFVDAIGGFIGPPAIALSYSSGILLGGIWSALPFLVVAAAYILCGGGMLFLEATG